MSNYTTTAFRVYVGTYTKRLPHVQGKADGIYVYTMDSATGNLTLTHSVSDITNPSFLTLDPTQRYLYAVSEVEETDGTTGGAVCAYAVDPATGALTFLNRQRSHGTSPCHVTVDKTGKYLLVANYGSGTVAVLPILSEGQLGEATDVVQHQGSGADPDRQKGPHAHSIFPDPANRFVLSADLGIDAVFVYRLDTANGKLVPNQPAKASTPAGSGPRHLAFHPNGRFVYVINELGSTMTAFTYDGERGVLSEIETISTLPEGYAERSYCADVHVHPSGRFLYGSNRGHDSIAIFAIDEATGKLTPIGYESTQGNFPRNFAIDPTGTYLYAANQNTDNIVAYRIDQATGKLTPTGHVVQVGTPVCVKIVPVSGR